VGEVAHRFYSGVTVGGFISRGVHMTYEAKAPSKRTDQLGFKPKRFWQAAGVVEHGDGFAVLLDGRPVKTPEGHVLSLPNAATAQLVADEWAAVDGHVDFEAMPFTRLGFAAVDRIDQRLAEAVAEALRFAETDLLCYPSEYPQSLVAREALVWEPILAKVKADLSLEFIPNKTLIHKPQSPETLGNIQSLIRSVNAYERAGIMAAMPVFGSIILALALWRGHLSGEAAFAASRIGEDFQAETWGADEEAVQKANGLKAFAVTIEVWFKALA
jgi:chaperone required for assembly of F1-ATPase